MSSNFDGKYVLIVDDDPDILEAIRIAFDETGASIGTATDGNVAVQIADENQPDLVVLDAMLPKRSGFLVLEKIKTGKKGTKPYVIMITGNQGHRHKTWAESLGVDEYIYKPFRMEKLMDTAERLLAN